MMTPVGRLILVRSVDKRELVNAMVWVTLPALIGPVLGPAARRLHHHLYLLALDLPDQHPDRARRHRAGHALHRGRAGRDARPVRPARHGAGRARRRRARLRRLGARARFPAAAGRAGADRRRRGRRPMPTCCMRGARRRRCSISRCWRSRPCAPPSLGGFLFRIGVGAMPFLLPLLLQLGFDLTAVPVRPDHALERGRRHER